MPNTRIVLSGSPPGPATGRVIPVAATATPGTTVHTAHATALDAVYLWATNVTSNEQILTIEWGGVLAPGDHITERLVVLPNDIRAVLTGQILTGSLVIRAYSGTANALNLSGFVVRIT